MTVVDRDRPAGPSKGARTREALLQAAVRRFAAEGFQRTSVADVARDVGVTPAAVYAYFASKEDLFAAAVDADAEGLVTVAAAVLVHAAGSAPLGSILDQMTNEVMALVERHPLVLRVLGGQERISPERVLALPSLVGLRELVASSLAEGQRAGRVRPDVDPKAIALGLETIVLSQLSTSLALQVGHGDERWRSVLAVIEAALTPMATE